MKEWEHNDTFLARWLNNELTEEERLAFEASEEFEAYKRITDTSATFSLPEYNAEAGFKKLQQSRVKKPVRVFSLQNSIQYAVAATVLIAAFITSYILFIDTNPVVEYQTSIMEKESYVLPDGSTVILNSGSTLTYNSETWDQERRIELNGEAFFKVEKGIPFIVETDKGQVTVLGTEFNVKSRLNVFAAACYTGKIRVQVNELTRDLNPGNGIQFQEGELKEELTVPASETPSWVSGITTLQRVPIMLALEELKLQFGINVQTESFPDSLIYTGSFPNNDPETAIRLILESFELAYTYDAQSKKLEIKSN